MKGVPRSVLQKRATLVADEIVAGLADERRLVVTKAPPGAGKTSTAIDVTERLFADGASVAISAQTNAQADDMALRLAARGLEVTRLLASSGDDVVSADGVTVVRKASELSCGPSIVVSTTAKWAASEVDPFDAMLIDEAWQMPWSSFIPLGRVAGRFAMIGDPGQIPPVVPVGTGRWETAPQPPHRAAPLVALRRTDLDVVELTLPASRRLPADSVDLVRHFYDFPFAAWARPDDRRICFGRRPKGALDTALATLESGSMLGIALPTPANGPPLELDGEVAATAAAAAVRLLAMKANVHLADREKAPRDIGPEDIGITATHRVMVQAIVDALPVGLRGLVRVDTPERWQGLERPFMVAVHPLSGVLRPSSFDLETGRLCVMASRHLAGLVVIGRDHIQGTLEEFVPSAEQPVGLEDIVGRGHDRHLAFWGELARRGRLLSVSSA